ncbi:MAG: hypothetical protein KKG47_00065 [Proteobacteria bacterium]|nr:hypothetical protein [Pseudomonadota bacterium]MBU1738489.1 hypothetical protein [Pseudomonadota bacterium]
MADAGAFKICPSCGTVWNAREEFLADRTLVMNGYQADFRTLENGLFLFTHKQEGCNSTMAVRAGDFSDLYTGVKYTEPRTGMEDCPGYCKKEAQLDRCAALCECAYVREIIQIIREE